MALTPISTGDTGASVRAKINAGFTATDAATTAVAGKAGLGDIANAADRPGDNPDLFGNLSTGLPEALASLPSSNVVTVSGRGRSYRTEGTAVVAAKGVTRIEGARKYLVRAGVKRAVDGGDPAGDAVVLAIQMLAADGTASGSPVALATLEDLTVASGARVVEVVVSTVAAADVDVVIPAGVYARVYWHTYGSTCETDIEFLARPLDVTAALAEAAARAAGDADAINAALLNVGRPGERPDLFTGSLLGRPDALTALSSAGVVTVSDGGRVYRLTPTDPPAARIVAPRGLWRVEDGRLYLLRGVFRRVANVLGTPSDTVSFGLQALTASAGDISRPDLGANFSGLAVGQRVTANVVVSTVAGEGVDVVLPAGTVYIRPYWWINSTTCTNDVEAIEPVLDITDWGVYSPDVTALTSRVAGIESQQSTVLDALVENQGVAQDAVEEAQAAVEAANDALSLAQTAVSQPSVSYDTLAELQASTAPGGGAWPNGVAGYVLTGADAGSYTKDSGASGGWRLISRDTLPAVALRVTSLESNSVIDDEVSADDYAFVARTRTSGEILYAVDQQGRFVATPSPSLIDQVITSTHDVLRVRLEQDERPITPLLVNGDTDEILIGLDEYGRPDFPPSDRLRTALQASPLANIQVTDRLPTSADNADAGYAVGNEWVLDGKCHVCQQATPTAVWAPARSIFPPGGNGYKDGRLPLPADAINGTRPVLAVGLLRPSLVTTKPCMRIGRDSDSTTLEVEYLGGEVDYWSVMAFIAGTRGRLEVLYNHGTGADLTWTGSTRPVFSVSRNVGGSFSIVFENGLPYNGAVTPLQGLTIPSSITMQSNNCAAFWVGAHRHALRDQIILELSGTTPLAFGVRDATTIGYAVKHSTWKYTGWKPHLGAMVTGFSSSASGFTFHLSDQYKQTFSALTATTLAGGTLGLTTQFVDGAGDPINDGTMMGGLIIYDRALTDDEAALVRRCLSVQYDLRPQIRGNLVVIGDSIEESAFNQDYESIARRMARLIRRPMNVYLFARGGGTFATEMGNFPKGADVLTYPGPVNLAILALGTNDAGAGATVSDLTTRLTSAVSTVRAAGADIILVKGIRPRESFEGNSKETVRTEWNALLRTSALTDTFAADGFIDPDAFPLIGAAGAGSNEDYYEDGTHQSELARGIEAPVCADYVDAAMIAKGYV